MDVHWDNGRTGLSLCDQVVGGPKIVDENTVTCIKCRRLIANIHRNASLFLLNRYGPVDVGAVVRGVTITNAGYPATGRQAGLLGTVDEIEEDGLLLTVSWTATWSTQEWLDQVDRVPL